ncbi:MAG TPA: VCBS repeat-containing protein [Kofleriaceae bacterium]|nr:VCBS repeat-containing protein [Kofleriaceae bacterium]
MKYVPRLLLIAIGLASCSSSSPPAGPGDCVVDGETIPRGESRTFYASSTVACEQSCQAQTRVCEDGVLSGDASFTASSCSVDSCDGACLLPWGEYLSNGASRTVYRASSVPAGETCESEERVCTEGSLSGSFTQPACAVRMPLGEVSFAFDQYLLGDGAARYFDLMMEDFTGDGYQDLLFTDHEGAIYNRYWRGNGQGGFTALELATYGAGPSSPERGSLWTRVMDFDNDGDLDWFWDDVSPPSLRINNGAGVFTSYRAEPSARVVDLADYAGCSTKAVLTTNGNVICGQAILDGTISDVDAGSPHMLGQATCASPVGFHAGQIVCRGDLGISESQDVVQLQSMVHADFDDDGLADLAFLYGASFEPASVRIYRNMGNGSFENRGDLPETTVVGAFANYTALAVADFNNDGLVDLVVPGTGQGYKVFLNAGSFTFESAVDLNDDPNEGASYGKPAVAVGDYNSDGKDDIAVINGARVKLYRNTSE